MVNSNGKTRIPQLTAIICAWAGGGRFCGIASNYKLRTCLIIEGCNLKQVYNSYQREHPDVGVCGKLMMTAITGSTFFD